MRDRRLWSVVGVVVAAAAALVDVDQRPLRRNI